MLLEILCFLWTGVTQHTWLLVFVSIGLLVTQWVLERRRQHSVFAQLGIPHITPHLIYGSNHKLRKKGVLATEVIGEWLQRYGKIFGYYIGWKPTLVVADLDLVKQILIKEFHNFSNRPKLVIEAQPVVNTVVGLRDQRWKDVRSILAPTFSMVKMKYMAGIMNEKIDVLLEIIKGQTDRGEPVEWYSTYQGLTLDVISECALAMKTNCQRDQNNDEFFVAVRSFLKNAINPAILLALYFQRFAKVLGYISNTFALSGRMTQMIVDHLKAVIAVRRHNLQTKNVDVLQQMLEVAENKQTETANSERKGNGEIPKERLRHRLLSDEEIIANAWVFLLGGFETTANSLTYTSYLLATHQDVQERLHREVFNALQDVDEEWLSYEQVNRLTYLDQVFSESLRLYPPVVTFITREAANDITIGQLFIPEGMLVLIPIWQIHRDPEQWPDPETFNPERFSVEAKATESRHPMAYIPFGAGPRNCAGMRFAQLEAKLALARLIKNYRLEPCEKTPIPLTFQIPTVAINPAQGVYIKAVPRK